MYKQLFSYAAAEQCSPLIEWVQNIFVAIHISFIFDLLTACLDFWQESKFITCGIRLIFAISMSTQHFSYAGKLFLAFDHSILDNLSSNDSFIRFCLLLADYLHQFSTRSPSMTKWNQVCNFHVSVLNCIMFCILLLKYWLFDTARRPSIMSLLGLFGLTLLPSCRRWYPAVVQGVPSTSCSFFV